MSTDHDSVNTPHNTANAAEHWAQTSGSTDAESRKRKGYRPGFASIAIVILVVFSGMFAAFAGGMVFERAVAGPNDTVPVGNTSNSEALDVFARAWEVVTERYVDEDAIDEDQMLNAAIEGMLDTLGDEGHTRYLTAEETRMDRESSQGSYVGIGVLVETNEDGEYVVVTPFEGSPAMEAGVQPGDVIVAVNGRDVADQTLQEVIAQIRGEEGSSVEVSFRRPGEPDRMTHTLIRSRIEISSVSWVMLDNNIALLRLAQFTSGAGDDLAEALREAKAAGAEGVVLDLRHNPGGFIREAMKVASMFVPDDSVVYISETRDGGQVEHRAERGSVHIGDTPFVVLINRGSASSSEIVSGAIKAAEVSTVIGEVTVGTGTVLNQFELGDGSTIWLGVELWLTPEGEMIRSQGIRPDVLVSLEEGQRPFSVHPQENGEVPDDLDDNQLEYAIRVLLAGEAGSTNPHVDGAPSRMH
jgi:carboxyl-terminal processing protease